MNLINKLILINEVKKNGTLETHDDWAMDFRVVKIM